MAWAKVQGAQSAGSSNNTSVAISAVTAGNTLVSFFSQTGLNTPTCSGFTVETTNAVYNGSLSSVWVATKIAAGGETSVSWTAGSGGTGHGVAAFELSGGPATVTKDGSVVKVDNIAAATTSSITVTTSVANSIILIASGHDASSGVISAWTGTNVATNIGTAAARCFAGHFVTTSTVSSAFTANWATSNVSGMLAIALQISAGGGAATQQQLMMLGMGS